LGRELADGAKIGIAASGSLAIVASRNGASFLLPSWWQGRAESGASAFGSGHLMTGNKR
jgi:hypothetical protein